MIHDFRMANVHYRIRALHKKRIKQCKIFYDISIPENKNKACT